MRQVEWYFDFVSPFSYLQLMRFGALPDDLEIAFRPVLFAGLLRHWGHLGPAEIPAKRRFTYRFCQWHADRHRIPFRMPPTHPFSPLRPLRLAVALDSPREIVDAIFRFIWAEGRNVQDNAEWKALTDRIGVPDADARIAVPEVRDALRVATDEAAGRGVFGVPTFIVDGELFWGQDGTEMLQDFLADPALFRSGEMARVSQLPAASERRR